MSTEFPKKTSGLSDRGHGHREEASSAGLCQRLAEVRREFCGSRGQARFAELLGLTPSTYCNYEKTRMPPVGLLVRVAELTGRSLDWLATGRSTAQDKHTGHAWPGNPQHWAILKRAANMLEQRPGNLAALAAFLDLLEQKTLLEQSRQIAAGAGPSPEAASHSGQWPDFGRWVPVFGRAAAGLARFWDELDSRSLSMPACETLDTLIARAAEVCDSNSTLAVIDAQEPQSPTAQTQTRSRRPKRTRVRLVQLSEPLTDYQLTEFLDAAELADRFRPLFGLRLHGDSMAPMFPDGTIVLCSPSEPARPGGPAVVRLVGQIGLTCKIYRPRESMVRLVAVNDKYEPQEFPARQLQWALAVLGSVRIE